VVEYAQYVRRKQRKHREVRNYLKRKMLFLILKKREKQ
jgi:hypothetical protein